MLSKLQNMGQSLRDVTAAIGDKTKQAAVQAKARITELQSLPESLPDSWEECTDEKGKPYYVDTDTGEWYRVKSKQHKRIDTNEKLSIITAESKKEFEEQKKQMDLDNSDSDSEIHTDSDSNASKDHENETKSIEDSDIAMINKKITHNKRASISKKKSGHSKRSSTSVSKGWQCEKCTLENVGHAIQCNACLAPRPEHLDEDEDEMAINKGINESNVSNESVESDENSDSDNTGHHQSDTIDAINAAVNDSLASVDGIDVTQLTKDEKSKLITFMDFVEAEPKPSLRYLRESNWDIQVAMDTYLRQHPDHPKSRGGSLQFDLQQIAELYDPINFEDDIQLPSDILQQGHGRRGSTELDEVPNDGVRDSASDNEEDSDSSKSKEEEISYANNENTGVRNEVSYSGMNNNDNGYNDYQQMDNYGHRRMNTDQQIAVAEKLSIAQADHDQQMDEYRQEIEQLKSELKESHEMNERLTEQNESLDIEKNRYAEQAREIQNDWDRMSGYMTQILSEVAFIEEQRKNGQNISTPTPKLHNIFEAIQNTITRNNIDDEYGNGNNKLENGKNEKNIYSNVADLFTEQAPIKDLKVVKDNIPQRKRKLSFGAVNELFTDTAPDMMGDIANKTNENNFLNVNGNNEHEKRLSYGGVGLLFDAFDGGAAGDNAMDNSTFTAFADNDNEQPKTPLNMQFTPTYDGIASLFDENNDVLGTNNNAHRSKPSFAGDIVELFKNPNEEYVAIQDENDAIEQQQNDEDMDEDSTDSMDKQRVYDYGDDSEEEEQSEEDGFGDEDSEEDEYKSQSSEKDNKEMTEQKKDETDTDTRQSMHQRFASYNSNMSDPTPISRRGSTSKRKHSRGPSFAFKDLFRGEEDSDSEDRAPSVQSAPEEHDYYAITAYYGIEDDDAGTGWDSRRSSMFGDYGRVHSRRQSKRVQSNLVEDNIKDMFKVDLDNKLAQHLSGTGEDNVADLFSNTNKKMGTVEEVMDEDMNGVDGAHVVADLFDESQKMEHKKRDTYTGVKQLFGDNEYGSGDEIDEEEFVEMRQNMLGVNTKNMPRPSSKVALGSTFDSISMIKDRTVAKSGVIKDIKESEPVIEERVIEKIVEIGEDRMREMRAEIREEEQAKLTQIQQTLEENYSQKLESVRSEIESEVSHRLRQELTQSLTQSIRTGLRQELMGQIRVECRDEMKEEFDNKLRTELNERMQNEMSSNSADLDRKMSELQETFDVKIQDLRTEMDERETQFRSDMTVMEQSKCALIQRTAQEIDSLREIIKNHFHNRNDSTPQNNSGILGAFLKWG